MGRPSNHTKTMEEPTASPTARVVATGHRKRLLEYALTTTSSMSATVRPSRRSQQQGKEHVRHGNQAKLAVCQAPNGRSRPDQCARDEDGPDQGKEPSEQRGIISWPHAHGGSQGIAALFLLLWDFCPVDYAPPFLDFRNEMRGHLIRCASMCHHADFQKLVLDLG